VTSVARRRRSTGDAGPTGGTLSLENGVVRTLDAAGSVRDGIAIGGDVILEGVDAGASGCERVDLRGRCVVPGFTDSHVHFPTWAMAQRWVRLESCRSLEETVRRVAGAAAARPDGWLVGYGWRSGDWASPCEPSKSDLDPVCGETPVALWSRDYHSLWLNSAALAHARGDLGFRDGLVPTGADGEPTGVLREHAAWRFRDRHVRFTTDEYASATADAIAIAHARGVTAVHDKDGWLDAPAIWRRVHARAPLRCACGSRSRTSR